MSFKQIKKVEGKYYKTEIVDYKEHLFCVGGVKDANCVCDSLELFYKLKKAGAKRVRGRREIERRTGDLLAFHFWVENNGIVFEKHGGVQTIMSKDEYYKHLKLTDIEVAEYSGFFRDELPFEMNTYIIELKQNKWGDKALLHLINTYRKKFQLNPLGF
jgi:hypothetical protein